VDVAVLAPGGIVRRFDVAFGAAGGTVQVTCKGEGEAASCGPSG
jgi:hypothetical protein